MNSTSINILVSLTSFPYIFFQAESGAININVAVHLEFWGEFNTFRIVFPLVLLELNDVLGRHERKAAYFLWIRAFFILEQY